MESHAESKFKATREVKKKYQLKMQLLKKQGDKTALKEQEEAQSQDMRVLEKQMKEKSESGKNEIKERYNQEAAQVQIDNN